MRTGSTTILGTFQIHLDGVMRQLTFVSMIESIREDHKPWLPTRSFSVFNVGQMRPTRD